MAILVRTDRSPKATTWLLIGLLFIGVSGCLVMEHLGWSNRAPAFSHDVHVYQEELECIDCHFDYEDEDQSGMPPSEDCMLCHEEMEEEGSDLPPIETTFYRDGEFLAANVSALSDEVIFSHLTHVTDEDGCLDCHEEVAHSDEIRDWMGVDMQGCVGCHQEQGLANECAVCHQEADIDVAPATHDTFWDKKHGLRVRECTGLTVDQCEMCHDQSSCVDCHQDFPPDDHTNYWRLRGHGLISSLDRTRCYACHTTDYCDRCHSSISPISHTGMWGSPQNNHCYGCHFESPDQSCTVCHMGTPDHSLAPPQPPGHDPTSDCRACHVFVPHADNGTDCNFCHL